MITDVKYIALRVTILFGLLATMLNAPVWAESAMIWSQKDAPDINIYYSPNGSHIVQITSTGVNISPNLFRASQSTWLTWVDKSNPELNQLKFARISASGAIVEIGRLPTVNPRIYAPAISLDADGRRVWLVWAEYNGRRENLYASFRDIGNKGSADWRQPMQITPDDEYSANIPIIEAAYFDRATISWMRSSLTSSGAASMQIMAFDWDPKAGQETYHSAEALIAPRRSPTVKKVRNYDAYAKRLKKGQPLSSDEQKWKNLVRNKKVLTGAVHTGSGASKRLADEVRK